MTEETETKNKETGQKPQTTGQPEQKTKEKAPQEQSEKKQAPKPEQKAKKQSGKDDNTIFVGKKPTMSYVLAVVTQFSDGANEVFVKARGRSISHAVDVAEAVKNKFVHDAKTDVEIGTDEVTNKEGKKIKVSRISIALSK